MRRALLFCAAIAFAIACGDDITEPIPDRTQATTPTVAFATTTTEDGLSISTDKDDYAPGDTVHFTGSGWQPGDVLDIVLTDDPLTHDPHTWSVNVDADGMFHDSTYVVDVGDFGVTFTLTATSRATGRSLTVTFTDGKVRVQSNLSGVTFSLKRTTFTTTNCTGTGTALANVAITSSATEVADFTTGSLLLEAPATSVQGDDFVSWTGDAFAIPNPPNVARIICVTAANPTRVYTANYDAVDLTVAKSHVGNFAAGNTGVYSIVVTNEGSISTSGGIVLTDQLPVGLTYNTNTTTSGWGTCTGGGQTITCSRAGGGGVAIPSGGSSTIQITVNVASSASGTLTNNVSVAGGGEVAPGPSNGNNTASDPTQVNGIAVATSTGVTSSQNPSALSESVTFTATVTSGSPATAVTTGQVAFKTGGTSCSDATLLQAAQDVNSSGQVTFSTSTLAIGSHVIRGCFGGASGFLASEGSVTQQVNNTATDLALISSVNPSVTGQSSTFTATVTNNSNPVTTGQVAFKKGGTNCSDATLLQAGQTPSALGKVSYSAAFLASQSPLTIRACYGGSVTPLLGASEAALVQTVNKADQTITFNPNPLPNKTYGDAAFPVTATASSGLAVAFEVGASDKCTISGNTVTITGAGNCTVTAKQGGDDDWNPAADVSRSFTIDPRPIKVKANDAGPTNYGDTPSFGYTLTGNFIGSDEAAFAATLSYGLTGAAVNTDGFRNVGTYTITPSWTYDNDNYAISLASPGTGTLTIVARPISIKANNAGPIYYGNDLPTFGYTLTGNFVVPANETAFAATLSYGLTGAAVNTDGFRDAGTYTITPSWTYSNTNYAISLASPGTGTLTIDPRPITVKANDAGPVYYGAALPTFGYTLTGNFVVPANETAFAATLSYGLSGAANSDGFRNAGQYTITPSWTYTNSNYAISLASPGTGTLTISPRPITIKANNAGPIYYADPLPTFTWYIVTGNFIASDQTAFTGVVSLQLSSLITPLPVGTHTITPVWTVTGAWTAEKEGNYAITPQTGSITVNAWTLKGFYQPVDMAAGGMIWNTVKGGFTVPLKFEVFAGSTEKTDVAIVKFFTQKANCPADPPTDAIEIVTTGGTTLRYDASAGQFVQNWQTPKAANICYVVTMTTQDGSSIVANFKTKS